MSQFEINKKYGNDLTITVTKRTAKFITFESVFGTRRCKITDYNGSEAIYFKCWVIGSHETFDAEKAAEITMYNAYYN